ncbi:MAG: hypothetical protein ACRD1F_04825, partial [Terriglobales bacterium]
RIAVRDLDGRAGLAETTRELSDLADAVLQQAYVWCWNELVSSWGTPQTAAGAGAELAVIALGKLGGGELNYSSDIDLMFAYSGEGRTEGGVASLSNAEFFSRLAQGLVRYVSQASEEGAAYRVDLRLRPGGREGELVQSLAQLQRYYRTEAREWELQMLVRARGATGARELATALLRDAAARIYPLLPDEGAIADGVRASRQAISAQLRRHRATRRRSGAIDVKLDPGGIRDIEFLTQYWQRLHGGSEPWVRSGHTLQALQRLHDMRRIRGAELQTLASAYGLLRHTEHRLQLRLGQQTHTLPSRPERLQALARQLSVPDAAAAITAQMFAVRALYAHYLEGASARPAGPEPARVRDWPASVRFSAHGMRQAQRLDRSLATWPDGAAAWMQLPAPVQQRVATLLEASDWAAETLIRRPALAQALARGAAPAPAPGTDLNRSMVALRVWQQQQALCLLSLEWDERRGIAATLAAHTQLAETTLRAGLDLASTVAPPAPSLTILGLGRLGLGEIDLLSDVDVVFVAAEADREAAATLAARWIEVMTAYTQAGTLYAVDTRLRPGGREGELVQTPASMVRYFEQKAGLWEALSYLKARVTAGDATLGNAVLQQVHAVLRQRFTDSSMSADLRSLRDRIEREGNPGTWGLKTVPGGYYDVDFLVSHELLCAGHSGTGPAGLAGWAQAAAHPELAGLVEYLRAADHALRVGTGKAGAAVPATGAAVERAWTWLDRTHPEPPRVAAGSGAPLQRIAAVRARIRELYQELL